MPVIGAIGLCDVTQIKTRGEEMNITTNNRVEDILGIKYPIIQAPLNWLTNAKFVS